MRFIRLFTIAAAVLVAGSAHAQSWYVFGGAGQVHATAPGGSDDELRAEGFTGIQSSSTGSYSTAGFGGGYAFSKRIALEISYTHLGNLYDYSASFPVSPDAQGTRSKSWNASILGLSAIGNIGTWSEVTPFIKASLYRMNGDFKKTTVITVTSSVPPAFRAPGTILRNDSETTSGSGILPAIGAGASIEVSPRLQLRGGIDFMLKKAEMFGAGNDLSGIRLIMFSVSYRL